MKIGLHVTVTKLWGDFLKQFRLCRFGDAYSQRSEVIVFVSTIKSAIKAMKFKFWGGLAHSCPSRFAKSNPFSLVPLCGRETRGTKSGRHVSGTSLGNKFGRMSYAKSLSRGQNVPLRLNTLLPFLLIFTVILCTEYCFKMFRLLLLVLLAMDWLYVWSWYNSNVQQS